MPKLGRFVPNLGIVFGLWLGLTNPQGKTIFVDSESVVAVTPGVGFCSPPTLTRLDLGTTIYCVRESIEDVIGQIRDAPRERNTDDTTPKE